MKFFLLVLEIWLGLLPYRFKIFLREQQMWSIFSRARDDLMECRWHAVSVSESDDQLRNCHAVFCTNWSYQNKCHDSRIIILTLRQNNEQVLQLVTSAESRCSPSFVASYTSSGTCARSPLQSVQVSFAAAIIAWLHRANSSSPFCNIGDRTSVQCIKRIWCRDERLIPRTQTLHDILTLLHNFKTVHFGYLYHTKVNTEVEYVVWLLRKRNGTKTSHENKITRRFLVSPIAVFAENSWN